MIYKNITNLIGNTPIFEVKAFDTGKCRLFLKLEYQNPGGSIKDRIALSMISEAEKRGQLKPGMSIVEATSGNTGIGLALVSASKGYNLILVIPDKMSQEKVAHMRALGADVRVTRSDVGVGHPEYYIDMAANLAKQDANYYHINQFSNPDNALAHIQTTGPEIMQQTNGSVDAVVCSVGSGGTITGMGKFFAKEKPSVDVVLADPIGSVLAHYVKTGELKAAGSWLVEGMGEDFVPPGCDLAYVKHAYEVSDKESFSLVNELLAKTGIFGGSSTGTNLAAALKYCREQSTPKNVVTFVCDSGSKYLSKTYNQYWLADNDLIETKQEGSILDLITRKHVERAVVSVGPDDSLKMAFNRMKLYSISQLPVLEDQKKIVGILDESDILIALYQKNAKLEQPVKQYMNKNLETLSPSSSLDDVVKLISKGLVAIVSDENKFYGLITQVDLINHLRRMN